MKQYDDAKGREGRRLKPMRRRKEAGCSGFVARCATDAASRDDGRRGARTGRGSTWNGAVARDGLRPLRQSLLSSNEFLFIR
jgi:hypothetical protein